MPVELTATIWSTASGPSPAAPSARAAAAASSASAVSRKTALRSAKPWPASCHASGRADQRRSMPLAA
jgi:hypothetical protein